MLAPPRIKRISALARHRARARACRYRERQRAGIVLVTLEIDERMIDRLASAGFVDPNLADDKIAVAAGLHRLLATLTRDDRGL